MKISSFFILLAVIATFATVQGWIVVRKFGVPPTLATSEAVLMGATSNVATPVSGLIEHVAVSEGQSVTIGQKIATIIVQSAADPSGETEMDITAQRNGTITDVSAVGGSFTHAGDRLATIVDSSTEALHVRAKLPVEPDQLQTIRPVLKATIEAHYLNNGQPLQAIVEAVDPVYNAQSRTIGLKLRLLNPPETIANYPLGIPVQAKVQLGTKSVLENIMHEVSSRFLSATNAQGK
jgi:multidrug resistance efflux pump